jgi:hypothetical protein
MLTVRISVDIVVPDTDEFGVDGGVEALGALEGSAEHGLGCVVRTRSVWSIG